MPESLACNFVKKETLAQVFSCEFCEISKDTFSYRTPPVAVSEYGEVPSCGSVAMNVIDKIKFVPEVFKKGKISF